MSRLLGLLAARQTREKILEAYPYLEPDDIDDALRYAVCLAQGEVVELAGHRPTRRYNSARGQP